MRFVILFLSLLFLFACQASPAPQKPVPPKAVPEVKEKEPWQFQVAGRYYGKIWSAGLLCSLNTNISLDEKDVLKGTYAMADQGKNGELLQGTLSDFEITGVNNLKCQWQDKYGKGTLEIKFSPEFSSFKGRWYTKEVHEKHPWDGEK